MKMIIYNALCLEDGNIHSINSVGGVNTYLKNTCVSLISAKKTNPYADVALVLNFEIPDTFGKLLEQNKIKIIFVKYENYLMPNNFRWKLAFYKLNALEYMVNNTEYDYYLAVDTDTYFAGDISDLWNECKHNKPVLFFLSQKYSANVRSTIMADYTLLSGRKENIPQCGGEFIAGSKSALMSLNSYINQIYHNIAQNGFNINVNSGDEAILSMAATQVVCTMANPYIYRFWTRRAFYDSSYLWSSLPIWHLPAEKDYGLIKMYSYLCRHGEFPNVRKAAKIFNLPIQNKWTLSMVAYYVHRCKLIFLKHKK